MKPKFKFYGINWWSNKVYKNDKLGFIVDLEEDGFYSLVDPNDIDSEPYKKIDINKIEIIDYMEKYLYVFNYNVPGIYEIILEKKDDILTCEEILEKYGFKEDECTWMFVDGKRLKLETIK